MEAPRIRAVLVLAAFFSNACGGSEASAPGSENGGSSGSGAATGGSAATGTGGGSGTAGCPTGRVFGSGDVDVMLAGLNSDLPAPSSDCLTVAPDVSMCAAFRAIVNGAPREILCTNPNSASIDGKSMSCNTADGGNIAITASSLAGTPPTTFAFTWTEHSQLGPIQVTLTEGTFNTSSASFIEARAAGWVNEFETSTGCKDTFHGAIAASWSDAGMGETRLRGTFHSRTF